MFAVWKVEASYAFTLGCVKPPVLAYEQAWHIDFVIQSIIDACTSVIVESESNRAILVATIRSLFKIDALTLVQVKSEASWAFFFAPNRYLIVP